MTPNLALPPAELETRIREAIAKHQNEMLLSNVRRVDVSFREDSTGDPAVYLAMVVPKDLPTTKNNIEGLNVFANILVHEILALDSGYWPYVRTVVED